MRPVILHAGFQMKALFLYLYKALTPEEKKIIQEFPFSPEGVEQAADWLNEQFQADKAKWEEGKKLI